MSHVPEFTKGVVSREKHVPQFPRPRPRFALGVPNAIVLGRATRFVLGRATRTFAERKATMLHLHFGPIASLATAWDGHLFAVFGYRATRHTQPLFL